MSDEHINKAITPFQQADDSWTRKCGGLGLAITGQLCELMGTIDVSSAVGKGSTFTVRLPVEAIGRPYRAPASRDHRRLAGHRPLAYLGEPMGLFSFLSPAEWRALGQALQLPAYAPSASYTTGISFRQVQRCRGVPAYGPPSFTEWFYGTRRGCEVFVLKYETGSGSSQTTWTAAIARIDPPLFLGLSIKQHGLLDKLFGGSDIQVGEPAADAKLDIQAFDSMRVPLLLSPADPACRNVLAHMSQLASGLSLYVGDSVVEVADTGTITDPVQVLAMLDPAIDLATWFAQRRRGIPHSEGELAQQATWQRFADTYHFTFDKDRMKLVGETAGSQVELALETEGQRIRTAVTVRFPHPLQVGFSVTRTGLPRFLQGLFGQDITVGDPSFDDAYRVTGHPEQAVREVLARPGLLNVLKHLGARARDIQLSHRELFFRVEGPSASTDELHALGWLAATTSQELFSRVQDLGPYR